MTGSGPMSGNLSIQTFVPKGSSYVVLPRFLAGSFYVSPVETDFIGKLNGELEEFPDLKAGCLRLYCMAENCYQA